jgi:hypothetical protein
MENYIVRVFRRDPDDSERLTGQVETAGKEEKKAFRNFEELMMILSRQEKGSDIRFCVE